MTTQTTQLPTNTAPAALPTVNAECTECARVFPATITLPGEILDCPDCSAELEVRTVRPLTLALAPTVEEDWGE